MMYQPDSHDEMPDWLQDLPEDKGDESGSDSPVSPPEEQVTPEDQTPQKESPEPSFDTEWLDDFLEAEQEEILQGDEDDDAPEWLKNIRELKRVTGTLSLPEEELSKGSGWLDKLQLESDQKEETAKKAGDESDIDQEPMDEFLSKIESESEAAGEVPEWLQKIRSQQGDPDKLSGSEDAPDHPDWLASVRSKHINDTQKQEIIPELPIEEELDEKPEPPEDDTPDWLHGLEEKTRLQQAQKQEPAGEKTDLPEWLQDIMADRSEEEYKLDVPLPEVEPKAPLEEEAEETTEDEEIPAEELTSEQAPEEADWIEQFRLDEIEISQEDLPEWVLEDSDEPEIIEDEIEKISEIEGIEKEIPVEEETPPELEAAEIPTWLDDFVPDSIIDTVSRKEHPPEDQDLKGPLVDLTRPLPLEPAIKKIIPPNIPTQDILLTDIQEKHVSYIFDLIKSESAGQKISDRRISIPQPLLQLFIAIVLMLTVIFPSIGQKDTVNPGSAPVNVQRFYDEINDLSPGNNVLVAVDYQASFAGELENGSGQILRQILSSGANISFISSNPIGPGLIDHLVKTQLKSELDYPEQDYSSIGYISGESAGLLHFAENPYKSATEYFQEHPNLSSISSIRDFSMLLIITDDLNNARSWLEQVQPKLTGSITPENRLPFLMLTSSQLDALMYPYFSTNPQKLNGYISGLKGIAQFETLASGEPDNTLWGGYSSGISITILILIAGSAYHFINSKLKNRQRQ